MARRSENRDAQSKERAATLRYWLQEIERVVVLDQLLGNRVVVATGPLQPKDVPPVEHDNRALGQAVHDLPTLLGSVAHPGARHDPACVARAARKLIVPTDDIAAVGGCRRPNWRGHPAHDGRSVRPENGIYRGIAQVASGQGSA